MKIYKDIFTGDVMFSDTYKIELVDEVIYEVYGKVVRREHNELELSSGIPLDGDGALDEGSSSKDGPKPSVEKAGAGEGTDENVESGVDIVLNHRLVETFAFRDKKSYTLYLEYYKKKLIPKLEEKSPDQVEVFKTNKNKVMEDILVRFKELQFFTGKSMDIDGMVCLMEYREINDEFVPVLMFFKHGLDEEEF